MLPELAGIALDLKNCPGEEDLNIIYRQSHYHRQSQFEDLNIYHRQSQFGELQIRRGAPRVS
jgi:hypothetical protein